MPTSSRPPDAERVTSGQIRVLLTLEHVCERDGRATVRSVAAELGVAPTTAQTQLAGLERAGLVVRGQGKLRPTYAVVAAG